MARPCEADAVIIHLGPVLPQTSMQPTRMTGLKTGWGKPRVIPIRSCSRWGLPCRRHCWRARWALTPPFHPYKFGKPKKRYTFCCTFPRVGGHARFPGRKLSGIVFPWSPDFPLLRLFSTCNSDHPTGWPEGHTGFGRQRSNTLVCLACPNLVVFFLHKQHG